MYCAWRGDSVPYPNIWYEFKAKESKNSDRILNYRIQDLPADRFDDSIQHLKEHFLLDAPISNFFGMKKVLLNIFNHKVIILYENQIVGAATNENYVEDYLRPVRLALQSKACMACFVEGSNEIVGLNIAYRAAKNDVHMPAVYKAVCSIPFIEN